MVTLIERKEEPPRYRSKDWRMLVSRIETERGHPICGGRRRNKLKPWFNGWPCERHPVKGRTRCRKHGGATCPPGPGHPSFKMGRYSRALRGTSLQGLYDTARTDPKLLALDDEIALLSARLRQTMEKLSRGVVDSPSFWDQTSTMVAAARALINEERVEDGDRVLSQLQDLLQMGVNDRQTWGEWFEGVEMLRRLVDTERKYREGLGVNLPIEKGMLLISIVSIAAQNVLSPDDAHKLRSEIVRVRGHLEGSRAYPQGPQAAAPPGREVSVS